MCTYQNLSALCRKLGYLNLSKNNKLYAFNSTMQQKSVSYALAVNNSVMRTASSLSAVNVLTETFWTDNVAQTE